MAGDFVGFFFFFYLARRVSVLIRDVGCLEVHFFVLLLMLFHDLGSRFGLL